MKWRIAGNIGNMHAAFNYLQLKPTLNESHNGCILENVKTNNFYFTCSEKPGHPTKSYQKLIFIYLNNF